MLLWLLLIIPLIGVLDLYIGSYLPSNRQESLREIQFARIIALIYSIYTLIISFYIYIGYESSSILFQLVQYKYDTGFFNIYLGVDGISIYFVLLTTTIMPLAILSSWRSITVNVRSYLIILLLLETLLIAAFLVLDVLLFYIFFESILPPLFLLIGIYGSGDKVRASFYIFLYTLASSLFLLLAILAMSSNLGTTDYSALFKSNIYYQGQVIIFIGVFIAIAVKTPTIFLNTWLLRAHVESPLGGSIILAAVVLKLSLYGIFRLILPILSNAALNMVYIIYVIGVITIFYASFSTLRTTDIKELIAYSSVSHAAVYLIGGFSNVIQGIEGSILLGLGHGFVSTGLFICAGGVLYDRFGSRNIGFYRGMTQTMPIFSIFFFILTLANCGTPLTLNFTGEFMSLYGTYVRAPIMGGLASASIVLSAAYSMFMFNRISFGGTFSSYFKESSYDLNLREFTLLLVLVIFTVFLGIYPSFILDGLHLDCSALIYGSQALGAGFLGLITGLKTVKTEDKKSDKSKKGGRPATSVEYSKSPWANLNFNLRNKEDLGAFYTGITVMFLSCILVFFSRSFMLKQQIRIIFNNYFYYDLSGVPFLSFFFCLLHYYLSFSYMSYIKYCWYNT